MRVIILDVEWWNKLSFLPNPLCMKISSYHKQLMDIVTLAQDEYDLRLDYDKMYVIRETIEGKLPQELDLLDERVNLIGAGMKFYSRYIEFNDKVILACRPDYLLYPILDENRMSKANIVQFYHDGQRFSRIQDYHNGYTKAHYTIVLDKDFWEHDNKDVEWCCKILQNDHKIIFKDTINMNPIISNNFKLKWFLKLRIDYSNISCSISLKTPQNFKDFSLFLEKYKKKSLPIKIKTKIIYSASHFDGSQAIMKDFLVYLKLICESKQSCVNLITEAPSRKLSPYWFLYEDLESWTKNAPRRSYFEFMVWRTASNNRVSIEECMKNKLLWYLDDIPRMIKIWKRYPDIFNKLGYIQWKDKVYIDFNMEEYLRRE